MRILVIGNPSSAHVEKFIQIISLSGHTVELFCSAYSFRIGKEFPKIPIHCGYTTRENKKNPKVNATVDFRSSLTRDTFHKVNILLNILRIESSEYFLWKPLKKVLSREFDLIISLKTQNEGYLVLKTLKKTGIKLNWMHYVWGTDIELFGKNWKHKLYHKNKIKKVLKSANYCFVDSMRDFVQVRKFGFNGRSIKYMVAHGGYPEELVPQELNLISRNLILVKGREGGHVGKANMILDALARINKDIQNYKVVILMPSKKALKKYRGLQKKYNLDWQIMNHVPHPEVIDLFKNARISIGASSIDGSPGFLTESIAFGAFPIYSNLDTIREWIEDGKNGFTFSNNSQKELTQKILIALKNDDLLEQAFPVNNRISRDRLDFRKNLEFLKSSLRIISEDL